MIEHPKVDLGRIAFPITVDVRIATEIVANDTVVCEPVQIAERLDWLVVDELSVNVGYDPIAQYLQRVTVLGPIVCQRDRCAYFATRYKPEI